MAAIENGTSMLVYVDGTAIASTTSHSLSLELATRDATTKSSAGWEEVCPGMRSWSIDFDALVNLDDAYTYDNVRALIANRTEVTLLFSNLTSGDPQWSGKAILTSVSLEAPLEDSVTMSGSFKGTGELTETTIT